MLLAMMRLLSPKVDVHVGILIISTWYYMYAHLVPSLLMIRMITRVMMVVMDTTSITAMATESPTVVPLLAGAPEPKPVRNDNVFL